VRAGSVASCGADGIGINMVNHGAFFLFPVTRGVAAASCNGQITERAGVTAKMNNVNLFDSGGCGDSDITAALRD